MDILHIANSYGGTEVYTGMFSALDRAGCSQHVFVPLNARNHDRLGQKPIDFRTSGSSLHYSTCLRRWHSYCHGLKVAAVVRAIEKWMAGGRPDIIHAHTAFFDGAVAHELSKRLGIPYVVAVRNTDVDAYYAKLWWKRGYFLDILRKAARIVFISPKYRDNFLSKKLHGKRNGGLGTKSVVIPNGVRDVYLANRHRHAPVPGKPVTVVYAGGFFERKGLRETVLACDSLRAGGLDVRVVAIGRGLPFRPKDASYAAEMEALAAIRPWVALKDHTDAEGLMEEYRKGDIFAMPSAGETFGLVYVEALSQGLPVVYARDEGFDGFRPDGEIGRAARAKDAADIARALRAILADYAGCAARVARLDLAADFSWDGIAKKYLALYAECGRKKR
jgi:glycosyltransferase involved in cell wall biosynthesis